MEDIKQYYLQLYGKEIVNDLKKYYSDNYYKLISKLIGI